MGEAVKYNEKNIRSYYTCDGQVKQVARRACEFLVVQCIISFSVLLFE